MSGLIGADRTQSLMKDCTTLHVSLQSYTIPYKAARYPYNDTR